MNTYLPAQVTSSVNWAIQQRAVAQKYGKRYIAYEAGQDVKLSNKALVAQIERDPRMGDLYKTFISQWRAGGDDTMALFSLTAPIDTTGYGLVEYAGQPLSAAPKMNAVRSFLAASPARQ
jgi:hypothetical protein